jgi:hypothetical protein
MSFLRFNDFFVSFADDNFTVARIFPVVHDLFSSSKFDIDAYRRSLTMDIGTFYSFLGDLFVDIGVWGTVIYLLIYSIIFSVTQKTKVNSAKCFHQVLIFFMLFQIPLNGLFFYSLWNKTASIATAGTIILSILFRLSQGSSAKRAGAFKGQSSILGPAY